jgi:hypothetical protein
MAKTGSSDNVLITCAIAGEAGGVQVPKMLRILGKLGHEIETASEAHQMRAERPGRVLTFRPESDTGVPQTEGMWK